MLREDVFITKMLELMAWYTNFNLKFYEIQNDKKELSLQYEVWYKAFKNFSDSDFSQIVDGYKHSNVYPPSSPTSLLDYVKEKMISKYKKEIDEAWQFLKSVIDRVGFDTVNRWSEEEQDYIAVNVFQKTLEKDRDQKIKKVVDGMYSKIRTMTKDNEPFVRKEFFEEYEKLLIEEIENNLSKGKTNIKIGVDDKLKLGEGK